MYNSVRN